MLSRAHEGRLLFSYILARKGGASSATEEMVTRYERALTVHHLDRTGTVDAAVYAWPVLLHLLDALSALIARECTLRKKLLIAAAVIECDPLSADWLLPRHRSRIAFGARACLLGCRAAGTIFCALSLLLFPSFRKRNFEQRGPLREEKNAPAPERMEDIRAHSPEQAGDTFDVIVIGSGPAGVHAAWPLVQAGKKVCMIDGGESAPAILQNPPPGTFDAIRRTAENQWKWFLGENLSNIPVHGLSGGHGGGMASGNRTYVTKGTEEFLPLSLQNAQIIQSLAEGGLGAVWGAACALDPDHELSAMGLSPHAMRHHYQIIVDRIGVSGPPHDGYHLLPPLRPDHHAARFLTVFREKKQQMTRAHLSVMQPCTAALTEDLGERKAHAYTDMDYYADTGQSVYRPQYTLRTLQRAGNFRFFGGMLVERITDTAEGATVETTSIQGGFRSTTNVWRAKKVILAAGAIGTARILLRSFGLFDRSVPFVAKPHTFIACLHPHSFGLPGPSERCSLCQLLILDEERNALGLEGACAQIYTYKSLQLLRLLGSVPLPTPDALDFLALLSPSLIIVDVRFPAWRDAGKTLTLRKKENGDCVHIHLGVGEEEKQSQEKALQRIKRGLRHLGAYPLRTMMLPEGSTSHYAGTVPFLSTPGSLPLSTDAEGKLHQGRHLFVADASVFPCLSAKPHTLTIMANANRIGEGVLASLGQESARSRTPSSLQA